VATEHRLLAEDTEMPKGLWAKFKAGFRIHVHMTESVKFHRDDLMCGQFSSHFNVHSLIGNKSTHTYGRIHKLFNKSTRFNCLLMYYASCFCSLLMYLMHHAFAPCSCTMHHAFAIRGNNQLSSA
jgi:hypothetical protein